MRCAPFDSAVLVSILTCMFTDAYGNDYFTFIFVVSFSDSHLFMCYKIVKIMIFNDAHGCRYRRRPKASP